MSDYLPREVITDILARLPVKTILQMRCVCKSWNSLITSDNFITLYLNRTTYLNNTNNTHLLLVRHCTKNQDEEEEHYSLHFDNQSFDTYRMNLESPSPDFHSYFRILGSCNGLVCLSDDLCSYMNDTFLWNPTIRKWVKLPMPRVTFESYGPHWLALGYGFDCRTNDYKVVRVVFPEEEEEEEEEGSPNSHCEVELYSLKEGSWRSISSTTRPRYRICYTSSATQAFVNGAVHWIEGGFRAYLALILLFDMSTEEFREMKLPTSLECESVLNLSIAVIRESLSVFQYHRTTRQVSIWVLKEYGVVESWTQLSTLDLDTTYWKIIGFRRNGELILASDGDMLLSFDLQSQEITFCGIRGIAKSFYVGNYTESLVLLNKGNEVFGDLQT